MKRKIWESIKQLQDHPLLFVPYLAFPIAAFAGYSWLERTPFYGQVDVTSVSGVYADIGTITTAIKMFELETGRFPAEDEWTQELTTKTDHHKRHMAKIPIDPWGNEYNYREVSENGLDFPDIWSNGPDGKEGTGDDVTNWATE